MNDWYDGWENVNFTADGDPISDFTKGYNNGYNKGKEEGYIKGRDDVKNMVLQLIDLGLEKRRKIFNTDSIQEILNTYDVLAIRKLLEANREVRVGDIVEFRNEFGDTSIGVITAIDDTICCIMSQTGHTCNAYKEEIIRIRAHLPQTLGFLHAVKTTIKED